jgi:3-deoxy-D-manno-octulosonic-acid transferase
MHILYNIGIRVYFLMVWVASLNNSKAAKWIAGRRGWRERLTGKFDAADRVIWFHCASLGEFEQGRPIIEKVREGHPEYKILLTFFSPSGYEKRKDFPAADLVAYLPLDTRSNAIALLDLVPVEKAVFIKYEFWYNYLNVLNRRKIPVYLVSGHFNRSQLFFRWYGGWYRRFLDYFTFIFLQDNESEILLRQFGRTHVMTAGDTRFDRVVAISKKRTDHAGIAEFSKDKPLVIAGSSWEKDEQIIRYAYEKLQGTCKWIIAPHEPSVKNIARLKRWFPGHMLFSELDHNWKGQADVLIVDTMGHLSSLYRYGKIAFIGGGFGKGIHNILEATASGLPVIFGPNYHRFREAVDLKIEGGAYVVQQAGQGFQLISRFLENQEMLISCSQKAENYTLKRTGATKIIVDFVFKSKG